MDKGKVYLVRRLAGGGGGNGASGHHACSLTHTQHTYTLTSTQKKHNSTKFIG